MAKTIKNEEDLGKALKNEDSELVVKGDLAKKIIEIRAVGKIAWVAVIGSIAVSIYYIYSTTVTAPVTMGLTYSAAPAIFGTTAVAASRALGISATIAAVNIAIAASSYKYLNKLRSYKEIYRKDDIIYLQKEDDEIRLVSQ